ncbi:hypothetical protein LTR17_027412 [Elasticomyces elasticus]|nr:hypothetical protein LTR17_027412 [Elasticomyces elasticus]
MEDEDVEKWKLQIETALRFFDKMRSYSVAAAKSKDVVERLYEASKHVQRHQEQQIQPHDSVQASALEAGQAFESFANSDETLRAMSIDLGQLAASLRVFAIDPLATTLKDLSAVLSKWCEGQAALTHGISELVSTQKGTTSSIDKLVAMKQGAFGQYS